MDRKDKYVFYASAILWDENYLFDHILYALERFQF